MSKPMQWLLLASLSGAVACSGSDAEPKHHAEPPTPMTESALCVISADCPAGSHCDLGECVQQCNTESACDTQFVCSPRARCLSGSEPDHDPEPTDKHAGTVGVGAALVQLDDAQEKFTIDLTATSDEPVRYRVTVAGPHLSTAEPRGEFTKHTQIHIDVDPEAVSALDEPGTVKIFTSLGDVIVDAPISVGVTGRYQGTLNYDGNAVALGSGRLVLDLVEKNGDVSARLDPSSSLLFPATSAGATTGYGTFDGSAVSLTVSQRVDSSFGGERNRFGRDVGRRVSTSLKPTTGGRLEGTFQETIYGLFTTPVELQGSIVLERVRGAPAPTFTVGATAEMPSGTEPQASLAEVFGWNGTCASLRASVCGTNQHDADICGGILESKYYQPLSTSLAQKELGTLPMSDVALACDAALEATTLDDHQGLAAGCALPPPLACALSATAAGSPASSQTARAFARQLARTVAPSLLVAQEKIVQGLYASFSQGVTQERERYAEATAALVPSARWVLQPSMLEFLRATSPGDAAGEAVSSDPTETDFPAARALARLLFVSSTLDGERARTAPVSTAGGHAEAVSEAQQRAVLTLLEAAALTKVLEAWSSSPSSVGVTLAGVLGPMDSSFGALVQGPVQFGIPDGFVPFVYRAEDIGKGANNFEQMLAIAQTPVVQAQDDQIAFEANKRQYEQNQQSLNGELAAVRTTYDLALQEICGPSFDPNSISTPSDWTTCGSGTAGEVGGLMLDIDLAHTRLQSAESRIFGMQQKIQISQDQLAKTQAVHKDTLRFIESNGKALEGIIWGQGVINAAQAAINTAANASVLNFGMPVLMGGVNAMLEMQKTALEVAKQRLHTAQTMRFHADSAKVELINGMADIQKQLIDLAQLEVDVQQDVIGVLQAQLRLANTVERAKSLHEERGRALTLVNTSTSKDPTYRLLRDSLALSALASRSSAQRSLYLAGRALEYEINQPLSALPGAVLAARDGGRLKKLSNCLTQIHDSHRVAYGTPQNYQTEVSLRRLLGITGPRVDEVTGQTLSEGELFRRELLKNENLDGKGGVGITFSTNLQPGNGLFSVDVCGDKIASVRAQIVGDFLGDQHAQVNLSLSGGSVMRGCAGESLTNWAMGSGNGSGSNGFAIVQAGVNGWGDAGPNTSLFGQSVARASWRLILPGGLDAPSNADLDLTQIEDVLLEIQHKALPRGTSPLGVDFACLASVGG